MKLCIVVVYITLFIFLCNNSLARNLRSNSTENLIDDTDWNYFFYPKIKVLCSKGCDFFHNTDQELFIGDCEYSCPRNVRAIGKTCSINSDGKWKPDNDGKMNCICAYTTDSCSHGFKHETFDPAGVWKTLLGCYTYPLGPPPPPFCDNFSEVSVVSKIVPVKEASIINPMIKVMVGKDTERLCADGKKVKIYESCASTREILHYKSEVLKPGQDVTLRYDQDDKKHKFVASLKNHQICAEYLSPEGKAFNKKQCYELGEMPKPKIKSGDDAKLTIVVPGYNHDRPFDLFYGQKHLQTGLSPIRPKRDKDGVIMRDKKGKVIEDKKAELCLTRKPYENDYSIKTKDGKVVRFMMQRKAFVPVRKATLQVKKTKSNEPQDTIEMWIKDDSRSNLSIQDTNQKVLDTIKNINDGTILLRPNMNEEERFKYQSIAAEVGGKSTPYVSYKDGKVGGPVVLTDDELKGMRPTSDFNEDLCFKQKKAKKEITKKKAKKEVTKKPWKEPFSSWRPPPYIGHW